MVILNTSFYVIYEEKKHVCDFLATAFLIMLVAYFIIVASCKNKLLHYYLASVWNCAILSENIVN